MMIASSLKPGTSAATLRSELTHDDGSLCAASCRAYAEYTLHENGKRVYRFSTSRRMLQRPSYFLYTGVLIPKYARCCPCVHRIVEGKQDCSVQRFHGGWVWHRNGRKIELVPPANLVEVVTCARSLYAGLQSNGDHAHAKGKTLTALRQR